MTVGELLDRMSAEEMVRWRLIEGIEPFGERRQDWRFAMCFSMLIQTWGGKVSAADLLGDLMDAFDSPASILDEDEVRQAKIETAAMAWAAAYKPKT